MGDDAVGWFAGLDVGGTNIQGALASASGEGRTEASAPTRGDEGPGAAVETMVALVRELESRAGERCAGVGIGLPGVVHRERGVPGFLPNLPPAWEGFPLAEAIERELGVACHLLNDARMATLGELRFGVGRQLGDAPTLALLTLGTGIGGGVVVDGRLRLGPIGAAGELGHQLFDPNGLPCGCGARGCVETVATGPALVGEGVRLLLSHQAPELYRLCGGDVRAVDPQRMAEAAAVDPLVAAAIERAGVALGVGVANVIVTLHPEAVVFSGGLTGLGERLLAPVRETVSQRVSVFPPEGVRIEVSEISGVAGALGGVVLAARGGEV